MSGRDLLALVLMTIPTFLAIALVSFTLVQHPDVAAGPTAARFVATADERAAKARTATQKLMRDPSAARAQTKSASARTEEYCDSNVSSGKFSCYYW
jgi:ABC-type microcin C transport system permease subunit YejB